MKKFGFGVDIGGTTVKLGIFQMDGTLLDKWEIPTDTTNSGAAILDDVATAISGKMKERNIEIKDVEGIGLGIPGPVTKGIVKSCVNLGWGTFNVEDVLSEKTGLPVKAANDANVAALGEYWQGGGKGYKNAVMVTLGTGVGGGIIIDGKILDGAHGGAGEIGHMHVDDEETQACGCGNKGCLEQYASATGIVTMAKRKLKEETRQTVLRDVDGITAKDIFDAAKAKDEVAAELVDKLCCILGKSIAGIACVVDPDVIIVGGGVSRAGDILIEGVKKYFLQYAFLAHREIKIVLATLGNDAGIYGCVGQLL